MKCPKCHYLSFDPEPRCRNCGYTFSLDTDLAIERPSEDPVSPLADIELRRTSPAAELEPPIDALREAPAGQATPPSTPRRTMTALPGRFDEKTRSEAFPSEGSGRSTDPAAPAVDTSTSSRGPRQAASTRRPVPPATAELPLFVKGMANDDPSAAPGRDTSPPPLPLPVERPPVEAPPPLAVQRRASTVPPPPRGGGEGKLGPLDRDLLEGLQRIERVEQREAAASARRARLENAAGVGKRLSGAFCDAALLGGLSAGIAWITLRWCDLSWGQVTHVPLVPLAAFLLLITVGYLFMFTAVTGQTIGKMVAGTRVVDAGPSGSEQNRLSARQAIVRELVVVPSVLALGAGFLPALLGDERALHDRAAQTRVVRL